LQPPAADSIKERMAVAPCPSPSLGCRGQARRPERGQV